MGRASLLRIILISVGIFFILIIIVTFTKNSDAVEKARGAFNGANRETVKKTDADDDLEQKLIFVGGMPRSGTTLMRTMLESHPDIRCGPETHVIPGILSLKHQWKSSSKNVIRLVEAGVLPHALDEAIAKFILSIVVHHAPPAKYYCNKDPYVLSQTEDGRATAHSIVTRKVVITGYDIKSYRDVLTKWSLEIQQMFGECKTVGPEVCLPVHYEQLVLRPVENTRKIFKFLDIPWTEEVLHHEQHLNGTTLSSFERSTDQVQRPLYLDALTSWCGHLPEDVERDMLKIAPMLKLLGYDPLDRRPNYQNPDHFVLGV